MTGNELRLNRNRVEAGRNRLRCEFHNLSLFYTEKIELAELFEWNRTYFPLLNPILIDFSSHHCVHFGL